jgi:hypothetical protein
MYSSAHRRTSRPILQVVERRELARVPDPGASSAKVVVRRRVARDERVERKAQLLDVVSGELMTPRNPHRARFSVESIIEPERPHPPADMRGIRLQQHMGMTPLLQLVRRTQACHPRLMAMCLLTVA